MDEDQQKTEGETWPPPPTQSIQLGMSSQQIKLKGKLLKHFLLFLAIIASILGALLELPLLGRADSDEELIAEHSAISHGLIAWAIAMAFWVGWFSAHRQKSSVSAHKWWYVDIGNIGCLLGALVFLSLLAMAVYRKFLVNH